jgi:hypothetical protein
MRKRQNKRKEIYARKKQNERERNLGQKEAE